MSSLFEGKYFVADEVVFNHSSEITDRFQLLPNCAILLLHQAMIAVCRVTSYQQRTLMEVMNARCMLAMATKLGRSVVRGPWDAIREFMVDL